ncbi:uncharacterized protein LOC128200239 [Galleria mellonella]|uniref:Uncharacterized protein LOC128200239 n=1 Tax=Galleria mellonella TaxID=7137 RepID=A0ABM3MCT4_GALME|nr:uncharacterized protein LOC128200239 [Galleria mellonella]
MDGEFWMVRLVKPCGGYRALSMLNIEIQVRKRRLSEQSTLHQWKRRTTRNKSLYGGLASAVMVSGLGRDTFVSARLSELRCQIEYSYIEVLKCMYSKATMVIRVQNQSTKPILVQKGVRQGDVSLEDLNTMLNDLNGVSQQNLKTKILNQCVLPMMTYGIGKWSYTIARMQKLQVTQRAMKRAITEDIRKGINVTDIARRISK